MLRKAKKIKEKKHTTRYLNHLLEVSFSLSPLFHPCLEAQASSPPYALWTLPFELCPLLILLLLDLMLVGIFPVYSILNCNLVCIRNGAHVNKAWWGSTPFPCLCLNWFYCRENIKVLGEHNFHECRGSTGRLLTAHTAMRGIFRTKMLERSPALHVMLIHIILPSVFQNSVCLSACAWTNLTSHSLQEINLFLTSVWGDLNSKTTPCSSQVPGSPLAQYLFCALNENRRTAILWYLTPGWVLFLVVAKHKRGEGEEERLEMGSLTCLKVPPGLCAKY